MIKQRNSQAGFNLLEVLIAIAIFAIGMMALASLQGNLTRSAADANTRTVAVNIAEELIENRRGFARLSDPTNTLPAFDDIVDETDTITHGGITYSLSSDVTDYWYQLSSDSFTTTQPTGAVYPDYKLMEVTVSWTAPNFRSVEGTEVAIGTGSITITDTISSMSSAASSKTVIQEDDELPTPAVDYSPGVRPDIVSLSLGDNKFKESLTPHPEVIRESELVETRFDVVTYSQVGDDSLFLRREEFIAVSCECEMYVDTSAEVTGRRPAVWAGDEYLESEWVSKPYGRSASNLQSQFCDVCCQDHHDGGSIAAGADAATQYYDPFRPSSEYHTEGVLSGNHKHYSRDNRGNLSLLETACSPTATGNCSSTYVEACRLVRKDGFFRVAQDFRQEGLNVFPYDFLDDSDDVAAYSGYVTGAVSDMVGAMSDGYETAPPDLATPGRGDADGDLTSDATYLPTPLGATFQQLRSRGIYVDYLSDDLRWVINCLGGGSGIDVCQKGDVILDKTGSDNPLELIPFFEVQLTFLNRWTEDPIDDPVDTTNEALRTGNTHSRGVASRVQTAGDAIVEASGHSGVLAFTDTDPIDPEFASDLTANTIQVIINTENPPDPAGTIISGLIQSGVKGVQASSIEIEATNATCDRTPTGFTCLVPTGASNPRMKIYNYKKQNRIILGCSNELSRTTSDTSSTPFAVFSLLGTSSEIEYLIWIEEDACTGPG